MVVASVLTWALLGLHASSRVWGGEGERGRCHPAGWVFVPFLGYAVGNVLWVTPVPWRGWFDWFLWFEIGVFFWVGLNGIRALGPRRLVFLAVVVVGLVAVWMGCYQRFVKPEWLMLGTVQAWEYRERASGPFGNPNSLAAMLLMLIPAVGVLALRTGARATERVWWGWVTLIFIFGLGLTVSRGPWLGLIAALILWPMLAAMGGWRRRVVLAVAVALGAILAGMVLSTISPKTRERFSAMFDESGERTRPIMWRAAWKLFEEHPAWGSGAGSYNEMFERHRPERFPDVTLWAHNDYLNTLSDYGLVGLGLLLGVGGWLAWRRGGGPLGVSSGERSRLRRERRPWLADGGSRQGIGVGLLAFSFQLWVDFHLKIPATGMISAAWAALYLGDSERREANGEDKSTEWARWSGLLVMVVSIGMAWIFWGKYRAEDFRFRARERIEAWVTVRAEGGRDGSQLGEIESALSRAVVLDPRNGQAWSDLAYVIALGAPLEVAENAERGRRAEVAAERALGISEVCYEFWVRRGVARDMQGRWLEAGDDFSRAVVVAPGNATAWYYLADHLSRNETSKGMTIAALEFCLRLDPANLGGLLLRDRLAFSKR